MVFAYIFHDIAMVDQTKLIAKREVLIPEAKKGQHGSQSLQCFHAFFQLVHCDLSLLWIEGQHMPRDCIDCTTKH
jgi:hypothetical protein